MEAFTIAAAVASIMLAAVAIAQSVYFYTQSKNTEARVQGALEGIKAQTEALQALNSRTLDRLTKYVTTPREEPVHAVEMIATTIKQLPDLVVKLLPPSQAQNEQVLRREIIHAYIALWYYTASANRWAAFCLPSPEQFDEQRAYDSYVRQAVDRSANDFRYMTGIIEKLSPDEVRSTAYDNLYEEVQSSLRMHVRDAAQCFADRAKQSQGEG